MPRFLSHSRLALLCLLAASAAFAQPPPSRLLSSSSTTTAAVPRTTGIPSASRKMLDAGFQVGMSPSGQTPTDAQLQRVNVALVLSVHADFATTSGPSSRSSMSQGGGV